MRRKQIVLLLRQAPHNRYDLSGFRGNRPYDSAPDGLALNIRIVPPSIFGFLGLDWAQDRTEPTRSKGYDLWFVIIEFSAYMTPSHFTINVGGCLNIVSVFRQDEEEINYPVAVDRFPPSKKTINNCVSWRITRREFGVLT